MKSMTGYGKAFAEKEGRKIVVELKAVNHRFLDLNFKLPRAFAAFEDKIRRIVSARVVRGHVDVFLTYADNGLRPKRDEMRVAEGARLAADMGARIDEIENVLLSVKARAPFVAAEYRKKLAERIREAVGNSVEVDEARLLNEAAFFADKSNIDEEIERLASHIAQARKIMAQGGECGKKLDFLIQEFNRETNTICSKSNDLSLTEYGLKLKNEIEKLREQVQNIE